MSSGQPVLIGRFIGILSRIIETIIGIIIGTIIGTIIGRFIGTIIGRFIGILSRIIGTIIGIIIGTIIGRFIGIISGIPNDQRVIKGPPTGHQDIESTTIPLQAIRRASRRHVAAKDPIHKPHR